MEDSHGNPVGAHDGKAKMTTAHDVLEDEIAKVRKDLAKARGGARRNPEDEEWQTLRDCAAEHLKSLERVKAALGPRRNPAGAP